MPRKPLELTFIDNNGRKATSGLYIPQPSNTAEVQQALAAWAGAFAPLSSAGIQEAIYTYHIDGGPTSAPQAGSNVYSRLVLLFRDGGNRSVISLPSPGTLPYDVAGPYRDIRLRREALALSGLLGPLEAALVRFSNPDGSPFSSNFVVAGKAGN